MDLGFKEIALVVLGFLLAHIPKWLDRRRHLKTHWCAIRAEMNLCREKAEAMLNDPRQTPLYRLPLVAFETAFPILLAEGALDEQEAQTLGRYAGQVQDMNRGLDNAADVHKAGDADKLLEEFSRNTLKAKGLIQGNPSLYAAAKAIVDAKIARRWWSY